MSSAQAGMQRCRGGRALPAPPRRDGREWGGFPASRASVASSRTGPSRPRRQARPRTGHAWHDPRHVRGQRPGFRRRHWQLEGVLDDHNDEATSRIRATEATVHTNQVSNCLVPIRAQFIGRIGTQPAIRPVRARHRSVAGNRKPSGVSLPPNSRHSAAVSRNYHLHAHTCSDRISANTRPTRSMEALRRTPK